MLVTDIKLPDNQKQLIDCYLFLTIKLRALWVEYVSYADSPIDSQHAFIYNVLFHEMEFYENLRMRVQHRLPEDIMPRLRSLDDYSGW